MKDWGIGEVLLNTDSDSVTVFFYNVGKKMISLKHADLKKISGQESERSILDNIKFNEPEHKGKQLCKNSGQPTQFQDTTRSYS